MDARTVDTGASIHRSDTMNVAPAMAGATFMGSFCLTWAPPVGWPPATQKNQLG